MAATLLSFACVTGIMADDFFEVLPQPVVAGSTSADGRSFAVELRNESVFKALQFDIYLPEGMEFDDVDPIELSMDRFPYTIGRGGVIKFSHDVNYVKRPDGAYRVVITSTDYYAEVKGNSGTLLTIYYVTADDMPRGVLPVQVNNVVMAISGTEGVRHRNTSTFFYTAGTDFSSLTRLDLSACQGTMFADVVEELNRLTAASTALTEIDVTGLAAAGADFAPANANCLLLVGAGTELAESLDAAGRDNVVTVSDEGNTCQRLVLTDGHAFGTSQPFLATVASYSRTLPAAGWYSLCLPFAATPPEGVAVERYGSADAEKGTITFVEASLEADVPCIFNAAGEEVVFTATDADIAPTVEVPADGPFVGTYTGTAEGDIEGCYALRADGSGFGRAGATAYVPPFRACLRVESGAAVLRLLHGGPTATDRSAIMADSDTDGLRISVSRGAVTLTAVSQAAAVTIASADGRRVASFALPAGGSRIVPLQPGVYVINRVKTVIR